MDYRQIAYDIDERVATITLDRPDQLNAFTNTMMNELLDAFDRADADDDVRAVVVTGRGQGLLRRSGSLRRCRRPSARAAATS